MLQIILGFLLQVQMPVRQGSKGDQDVAVHFASMSHLFFK